jgi:hypothetical protein
MKKILAILFVSTAFSSCYYDKEEDLFPANGACDTGGVTYLSTVLPLLQSNACLSCHSGGAPSGNISLDGYTNVKTVALNGKLYGTISHAAGYSPMPQGGNKMNACNINRIKAWIDAGVPNN